ncbi:3-oxoacid CoA-transferase subunit B [Advenella mimigardefordensis]|uniref:3-oxoadipate CoA-transferase subunit B n=1 Tax=Advenella mimigardefordensis (strain DSM 17166 / LMG 22922 / DPN7) TaxID=1247726 RepID=W0P918_ADVMD|nr:3-oxoacid CoA-transferase subunit B [Advenella mimigardefordensis]AHG63344.1 3-oxoadipate CoA-transferase subunit B [Advenella mimigardefordensis DPN7]
MTEHIRLNREQIARLVANSLPDGAYVNLGIGMPTSVADYLPPDREIILHSENGILGMGRSAINDEIDTDIINASRKPIVLLQGASITEHTNSFAMMRGGHLDYSILGGFQVAENGDLANWITDAPDAIAAIGGAMDLAVGAKQVLVMMEHTTKTGEAKLLHHCTYPLTGAGVVDYVYTDLAIIQVCAGRFIIRAMVQGLTQQQLQGLSEATLHMDGPCQTIRTDSAGQPYLD